MPPVNRQSIPLVAAYTSSGCTSTPSFNTSSAGYGNSPSPCITSSSSSSVFSIPYQLTCYGGYHIGADWSLVLYPSSSSLCNGTSVTFYGHGSQCVNLGGITNAGISSIQVDCSGLNVWSPYSLGGSTYRVAIWPSSLTSPSVGCNASSAYFTSLDVYNNTLQQYQFYKWTPATGSASTMWSVRCSSASPYSPYSIQWFGSSSASAITTSSVQPIQYSWFNQGKMQNQS